MRVSIFTLVFKANILAVLNVKTMTNTVKTQKSGLQLKKHVVLKYDSAQQKQVVNNKISTTPKHITTTWLTLGA